MAGEKYEENYNEYEEKNGESNPEDIKKAIEIAQNMQEFNSEENKLQISMLSWIKVDFKTPDSINNFYRLEEWNIIFQLDNVKSYLDDVFKRLSWMKTQNFWKISKENNFTWTILAIQIVLKAISKDPKNPKKYNISKINGEYNDTTKSAIMKFQEDHKLTWIDGKPWKETIWRIVKELDNLINNKKLEKNEEEILKTNVSNIIEESIAFNPYSWIYPKEQKEIIINYILNWKLNSGENSMLETQIRALSSNMMNWKLKYLIQHSNEPLKNNIQNIKAIEEEKKNRFGQDTDELTPSPIDKKESFKKWWDKISEDMFQQLLIMEWGQWYKAQVHREFRERFPTWPYGMVYKHIDKKWNLLKDIVPFKNGERVSKEWALDNARAYYNKRAQEWKALLDEKWYSYTQSQLDSLVSASWWTENATDKLKNFVLWNRNDKNKIFNFMITFARTAKGKIQWGLVARRKFEANWFMWTKKSYREYQEEYAQNRNRRKKK